MAKINLRPWREELAQKRKNAFAANLVASIACGAVLVFGVGFYFDMMKDRQFERNNYLRDETSKLDRKIAEIKKLKEQRARLLERLNAIQELQGTRPVIVRNFDEIVRVLPDGAYYTVLNRSGEKISITGLASDKTDVSSLMRNLDDSIWFGEPNLSNVGRSGGGLNSYSLTVPLIKPKAEEAEK